MPCMRRYDGNKKAIADIDDRKTACSEAVRRAAGGGLSGFSHQVLLAYRIKLQRAVFREGRPPRAVKRPPNIRLPEVFWFSDGGLMFVRGKHGRWRFMVCSLARVVTKGNVDISKRQVSRCSRRIESAMVVSQCVHLGQAVGNVRSIAHGRIISVRQDRPPFPKQPGMPS